MFAAPGPLEPPSSLPHIQRGVWCALPPDDPVVGCLADHFWDRPEPPQGWEVARLSSAAYLYREVKTAWAVVAKFYAVKTHGSAQRHARREFDCTQQARGVGLDVGEVRAPVPLGARQGVLFHHDGHCAHQGQGVHPVPQAAAPEDERVIGTDAGHHAAQGRCATYRRLGGQAEGQHVNQVLQERVIVGTGRSDSPGGHQCAQVQIALALGGAEQQVTGSQLTLKQGYIAPVLRQAFRLGPFTQQLQVLQQRRVVEVEDQRDGEIGQFGVGLQHVTIRQHYLSPGGMIG